MNRIVFLVSILVGYLLARFLPEGAWSAYAPMLISYHLFLAYLVFAGEHKGGFSMPVFSTILTHSAFLAILIGLAVGRHYVPFFSVVRVIIPALAPFESKWLFSGGKPKKAAAEDEAAVGSSAPASIPLGMAHTTTTDIASTSEPLAAGNVTEAPEAEYTADDQTAWLHYLAHPRRAFRKPGRTVADEFKEWKAARAQLRAILAQNQQHTH
jgi:hypothetical protein